MQILTIQSKNSTVNSSLNKYLQQQNNVNTIVLNLSNPTHQKENFSNQSLSNQILTILYTFGACVLSIFAEPRLFYDLPFPQSLTLFQFFIGLLILLLFVIVMLVISDNDSNETPTTPELSPQLTNTIEYDHQTVLDIVKQFPSENNFILIGTDEIGSYYASLIGTNQFLYPNKDKQLVGVIAIDGFYNHSRTNSNLTNSYQNSPVFNIDIETTPPHCLMVSSQNLNRYQQTIDYHYALKHAGVYVQTEYNVNYDTINNFITMTN
jgi:hypothetical protein